MVPIFNNISYRKVKAFLTVSLKATDKSLDRIKTLYQDKNDFSTLIEFLLGINLITIRKDKIIFSKSFSKFYIRSEVNDTLLKETLGYRLLNMGTSYRNEILAYFNTYELINNTYLFTATSNKNLEYSGIRNFLLEIGVVSYDRVKRTYSIAPNYIGLTRELFEKRKLSYNDFKRQLLKKEKIGRAAEQAILRFENDRLAHFPELLNKIEYTADCDVLAGYDIKSWEDKTNTNGIEVERYIEVKSVPENKKQFYWSRNEIKKAKEFENQYYLYLVPMIDENRFDINNLEIIRNPYLQVFKSKSWELQTESYYCKKK